MNSRHTTIGRLRVITSQGCRRLLAIGLASLAISACSGTGSGGSVVDAGESTPAPGGDSGGDTSVLDCERDGYPCSFAEVSLPVIERSLALSDDVAQQLVDGADIDQVAALLEAQGDVVDVIVDGPVLGFRLAGGRPMIVDVTGDQEMLPVDSTTEAKTTLSSPAKTVANPTDPVDAAQSLTTVRTVPRSKIVAGNGAERHALVLSPFRYEFGDVGEQVAQALAGVRGYAGNVTYLATTNEFDPQVTVDTLTQLQDYSVIQIDTHGGTLCKTKEIPTSGLTKGKDKKKCDDGITDFLVQRFHGTAADLQSLDHPGIVHYRGSKHQSIAVTADFFRHYYPEGLSDTLFYLGACNTYRSDMVDAIGGDRGVFLSWDGYIDSGLVQQSSLALLEYLGQGLTVRQAFDRLPGFETPSPEALESRLWISGRKAGGDLRIRDLMYVRDNISGKLVSNTSGIEIHGLPGDGQNDNLDLEFVVDGITPDQLGNFFVNLVIDGHVIGHLDLEQSGVQLTDFRYLVSTPVPLPFDAETGETLDMDFWIPLPDLGEDRFVASPEVYGPLEPEVGSEWTLTSRATSTRTDDVTVKTASVTFELEPDDDPEGSYHYFRVKSGSVHIQREYEDALGCRFRVDHTIDLTPGASNNYLNFDASSAQLTLDGFGSAASEIVPTTGSCGDSANVSVGGVYFNAEDVAVSGDAIQGGYNDGVNTVIEWSLTRTL